MTTPHQPVKLFISGFPLNYQEIELAQLIAIYGEISTIKIVRDRRTGKCKGYAFVEMADLPSAENVIAALNGIIIMARELTLKFAEQPLVPAPSLQVRSSKSTETKKKRDRKPAYEPVGRFTERG
jgi:RNA recognition motif-containing protein